MSNDESSDKVTPKKSKWRFIAVLAIIALIVLGVLSYLGAQTTPSDFDGGGNAIQIGSTTQTSTHVASQTITSELELLVSTNETSIKVGQELAVTATLFNPLGRNYNISTKNVWPFNGLLMFSQSWPYCYFYSPFELLVLKGNFSVSGVISTTRSIGPNTTSGMFCYEQEDYRNFRFEPSSDSVYVASHNSVTGNVSVIGPQNASITVSTNGYWDNNTLLYYPPSYTSTDNYSFLEAQHPFVEGVYTIAVSDEWGQLDVIHFTVD